MTLLELGLHENAEALMRDVAQHKLLYDCPGLYHGTAGVGLTSLAFFHRTQDQYYLDFAVASGDHLIEKAISSSETCHWIDQTRSGGEDSELPFGLGYGAAGIALFFLHLYLTTQKDVFLKFGMSALQFEFSKANTTRLGGMSWPRNAERTQILYPYVDYGSAGIGMVALRYYAVVRKPEYIDVAKAIFLDMPKLSVFPGYSIGLSGVGQFLLDMWKFLEEERYLNAAKTIASSLKLFSISRSTGMCFPGNGLSRLSCDFSTGSAGVALFLHRLVSSCDSPFMFDDLLSAGKELQPTRTDLSSDVCVGPLIVA